MSRASTIGLSRLLLDELSRAQKAMRYPGHPRPYYLSYLVRDEDLWVIDARYGALFEDSYTRRRDCLADVRVGSYKTDQVQEGGLHDNSREDESFGYVELPLSGSEDGVRHALWRLTEAKYREAVDAYLRKRSVQLTYKNANPMLRGFERREAVQEVHHRRFPPFDRDARRRFVVEASRELKRYRRLKNGSVKLSVRNQVRTFVSSEGSLLIETSPYWSLELYVWFLSGDGASFPLARSFFVTDPRELPSLAQVKSFIRRMHDRLVLLAKAPTLRAFSGPVLLEPKPAGLLVHEAIGHRLEGNRLLSTGEGHTFRDSLGQPILPTGFHVWDDPRMTRFAGHSLAGHYGFDDEGVPAERASLIEDGHLTGFLTSRAPIGKKHASNGHGRSRYHARAISRMGVTVMQHENGLSDAELERAFLKEIRDQGVPYGVRIIEASGGETATDSYDFQAFLGQIDFASRVYPNGKEELVRGVDFVGTPLNAVRSILAASARTEVDNAYCGAESGDVPVSTISPALLVEELELQYKPQRAYAEFAYPMPWERRRRS